MIFSIEPVIQPPSYWLRAPSRLFEIPFQLFAPPSQSSDLSPSMMRTLQTAGSGLASSSGDLRALDLSSWMFTSNNFLSQSMSPGGFFGNSLTQNYFQCPLDVPFCARQECSGTKFWKKTTVLQKINHLKNNFEFKAVMMLMRTTAIPNQVAVLIKICSFIGKCLALISINRKNMMTHIYDALN